MFGWLVVMHTYLSKQPPPFLICRHKREDENCQQLYAIYK